MTIEFYDAVNGDGLFDILGKFFQAQTAINTFRQTTLPGELTDIFTQLNNLASVNIDYTAAIEGTAGLVATAKSQLDDVMDTLSEKLTAYTIEVVHADVELRAKTITYAAKEIIAQMVANSKSVDASTVSATAAAVGTVGGDGVIIVSTKRGDGKVQEYSYAEVIDVECTVKGPGATLLFSGEAETELLASDWPKGSGASKEVIAVQIGDTENLVTNPGFEDEDDQANVPDDWQVSVGTIGTTTLMTNVEAQTVVISGTPTGGTWGLIFTDLDSKVQYTAALAYNATSAAVQAALRALEHLGSVTVATTGTSPNYTHTVTFTGYGGNLTQMTSVDNLTGGSPAIAHATTIPGTGSVYHGGKALIWDSDGATLDTLNQRIEDLKPETCYAINAYFKTDSAPAAGVITVDLVDGIGGTVLTDEESNNNALTFNASTLTTSWQTLDTLVTAECVFCTPRVLPDVVYLRLRISTAVSNTSSVYLDDVVLTEMTSLYGGGPLVAVIEGESAFRVDDTWTATMTNDRAGLVGEWANRNFDLATKELLIPSATGAAETVPDGVVS